MPAARASAAPWRRHFLGRRAPQSLVLGPDPLGLEKPLLHPIRPGVKRTCLSPRTEQVCPAGLSAPPGGPATAHYGRVEDVKEGTNQPLVGAQANWADELTEPPLQFVSFRSVLTSRLLVRPCGPLLFPGSGTALPRLHKRQPELLASAFSVSRRSPLASGFPLLCSVPGLSYRICAQ